jgi:hypothetical protein
MSKNELTTSKIVTNSVGILLVSILANFLLPFIAGLLFGPFFFYFNYVTVLIGPVVLIIFLVRGIRLFKDTKSIRLVIGGIIAPLFVLPGILMFCTYLFGVSNDLPLNIFAPEVNWVIQSIHGAQSESSLNNLVAQTEVNPTEICLIRKSYGDTGLVGRAGSAWMYQWALEWRGAIKSPVGNVPSIFATITNGGVENGTAGIAYIENADRTQSTNPRIYSDGKPHVWKIDFEAPRDGENTIHLFYTNEAATNYKETLIGKFYLVSVPEILLQKINTLSATENTSGYRLQEYYANQLTETEQLAGAVCAPLTTSVSNH